MITNQVSTDRLLQLPNFSFLPLNGVSDDAADHGVTRELHNLLCGQCLNKGLGGSEWHHSITMSDRHQHHLLETPPPPAGTQCKSSPCLPGQPGAPLLLHQERTGLPHDVLQQDTSECKATQAAAASLEVNSVGPPQAPAPPRTQRWPTAGAPVPQACSPVLPALPGGSRVDSNPGQRGG